ncbi:lysozyme-like [Tropilaelaps mercedesae]|uniref:lysozyme n=1 Tax=Tropilaelaps mercedesae TaxID=418985 RepID=A0A1V9X9R8_9ACAR|nr:lysozyme-like [Tropilaelaps mercedesae]
MNTFMFSIISYVAVVASAVTIGDGGLIARMSDAAVKKCLDCICQASTKCIPPKECWKANDTDVLVCGAYLISEKYWIDAGEPFDREVGGYFKCAYHKICAENTIIAYNTRHGRDCDGNGVYDCLDIGLMHHGEKDNCENPWIKTTDFWKDYTICLS